VTAVRSAAIGADVERVDGRTKVAGEALYAYDYTARELAYGALVQSTVAAGSIRAIDSEAARSLPGVITVLSHENAPQLGPVESGELSVMQSPRVAYRGQIVGAVIAERLEIAQEAAALVRIEYDELPHDVELRADHAGFFMPDDVLGSPADTSEGDLEAALAASAVTVDAWFSTPAAHANPMEPHASLALWEEGSVTVYESSQFAAGAQAAIASAFELPPESVRVICPFVGGGFGSKGEPRPHMFVAIMAARVTGRPVKIALSRRQMFPIAGYRSPSLQRVRLGADASGKLLALAHHAHAQTSTLHDFIEPTCFDARVVYAAESRATSHRLVRLDVPTPGFVRGPGHAPGSFAFESAMDELAERLGIDPIELRIRNEPEVDPENGLPFSSRNLVACLREGAERFGWPRRRRRDGPWLVGAGVAAAHFPTFQMMSSAIVRAHADGRFTVLIDATDVGTGARTVLAQIAADELDVPYASVQVELGDSRLPWAIGAFGSMGTSSWGSAVVEACRALRSRLADAGELPPEGIEAHASTAESLQAAKQYSTGAYAAQFAEVRVDSVTREIRVSQLLGVFAAGRILSPRLARSQFIGGMTWGVGAALLEESVMDTRFGEYVNADLASYHVVSNADIEQIDVHWIDEVDPHVNAMGSKGIGEIGIVGVSAAIANAVYAATGVRVRDLPIRLDKLFP
jgi:xanthine dehydrogenase YagR molybdenum-binding subunit